MTGPTRVQFDSIENVHATSRDFCRIFTEGMQRLYTLALLLTADHAKAEDRSTAQIPDCLARAGAIGPQVSDFLNEKRGTVICAPEFVHSSVRRI